MGKLIVLEGIDGSGKSTLISELKRSLPSAAFTREPTSSRWGKLLRAKLGGQQVNSSYQTLFFKDRLYHNKIFLRPSLENHDLVISDRYYFSTAAYQGSDQNEARSIVQKYAAIARIVKPEMVIFLDIPVAESIKRIRARNLAMESFEREEELTRITQNYKHLATHYSFKVFNALQEPEKIAAQVLAVVGKK